MNRLIAIALAGLAAAGTARAEPVRHDVAVNYSDLDLSKEDGAQTMLARIERAAAEACSNGRHWRDPDWPHLSQVLKDLRSCQEQAVADAVRALNAPLVSRDYARMQGPDRDRYARR
jgi:UrcA family protein